MISKLVHLAFRSCSNRTTQGGSIVMGSNEHFSHFSLTLGVPDPNLPLWYYSRNTWRLTKNTTLFFIWKLKKTRWEKRRHKFNLKIYISLDAKTITIKFFLINLHAIWSSCMNCYMYNNYYVNMRRIEYLVNIYFDISPDIPSCACLL